MDELNKRVLSVMDAMQLSRSAFAGTLDISLPVLTHISSGRNKPGLELIQKIIAAFPNVDPEWLLLGKGTMFRKQQEIPDISAEIEKLSALSELFQSLINNETKVWQYHQILHKEISYLQELDRLLVTNVEGLKKIPQELKQIEIEILSKLKD